LPKQEKKRCPAAGETFGRKKGRGEKKTKVRASPPKKGKKGFKKDLKKKIFRDEREGKKGGQITNTKKKKKKKKEKTNSLEEAHRTQFSGEVISMLPLIEKRENQNGGGKREISLGNPTGGPQERKRSPNREVARVSGDPEENSRAKTVIRGKRRGEKRGTPK